MLLLQTIGHTTTDAAQKFQQLDPMGIGMTVIAISVVFLALTLLYLTFKNIARIYSLDIRKKYLLKKGREKEAEALTMDHTGELGAAVAMALFLYQSELHDHENTLITLKKVAKTYSPWSSKIYGLRKNPKN